MKIVFLNAIEDEVEDGELSSGERTEKEGGLH
jgi:hypothetical protein